MKLIFGCIISIIIAIGSFMLGYNLWQYSNGFEENCKHCSWNEARSGSCEWSLEELDDQEYFRGDNNPSCGDMGSYEMAWKVGMMFMILVPSLIIIIMVGSLFSRKRERNEESTEKKEEKQSGNL